MAANYADPAAQGIAIAAGTPGANNRVGIQFQIDTVVNISQGAIDNAGNFTDSLPADAPRPDDVML